MDESTHDRYTLSAVAAVMSAAARYNAHGFLTVNTDAREYRGAAVEDIVRQYRALLEEYLDRIELSRRSTKAEPGTAADGGA